MTSLFEQTEQPVKRADLRPHAFESVMHHHSAQGRRIHFLAVGYGHVSDTECASSVSTVASSVGLWVRVSPFLLLHLFVLSIRS